MPWSSIYVHHCRTTIDVRIGSSVARKVRALAFMLGMILTVTNYSVLLSRDND